MQTSGIGAYIRSCREKRGQTQRWLADAVGLPPARIAQIEGGRVALPGADLRRRLAKALEVSHLDLLIAAGELLPEEVTSSQGVVERDPDDPRSRAIAMIERMPARKLPFTVRMLDGIAGADQDAW